MTYDIVQNINMATQEIPGLPSAIKSEKIKFTANERVGFIVMPMQVEPDQKLTCKYLQSNENGNNLMEAYCAVEKSNETKKLEKESGTYLTKRKLL